MPNRALHRSSKPSMEDLIDRERIASNISVIPKDGLKLKIKIERRNTNAVPDTPQNDDDSAPKKIRKRKKKHLKSEDPHKVPKLSNGLEHSNLASEEADDDDEITLSDLKRRQAMPSDSNPCSSNIRIPKTTISLSHHETNLQNSNILRNSPSPGITLRIHTGKSPPASNLPLPTPSPASDVHLECEEAVVMDSHSSPLLPEPAAAILCQNPDCGKPLADCSKDEQHCRLTQQEQCYCSVACIVAVCKVSFQRLTAAASSQQTR